MRTKRGQALIELACGMLTIALLVSVICGFGEYSAKSLKVQNSLRSSFTEVTGEKVYFGAVDARGVSARESLVEELYGFRPLRISENVDLPSTTVQEEPTWAETHGYLR